MICKNDVCKYYDENWPGNCKSRPDAEKCGSFLRETPLKAQTEPVAEVPCSVGLCAECEHLKALCRELLEGAHKCTEKPHYIVQPFLDIVKRHGETIDKHKLI